MNRRGRIIRDGRVRRLAARTIELGLTDVALQMLRCDPERGFDAIRGLVAREARR